MVQRHRARRLHYDLRFEIDGVLVSWAVPKGPTLDPKVKRIAIHVEDHPIEYLDFEGVIPAREYGGGDVIVWDIGTWQPHDTDDPAAAVAAGELHADVNGHKLHGRLVLVRSGRDRSDQDQWLLLHKNDDDAVEGWDPEEHPRSVLSGRTNDEVKANPERMWRSDLPAAQASVPIGSASAGPAGGPPPGRAAGPAGAPRSRRAAGPREATRSEAGLREAATPRSPLTSLDPVRPRLMRSTHWDPAAPGRRSAASCG